MDGLLFEVIAEGEVAEHLEEGAMTRGLSHLLDVEGAHALLVAGHAAAWRGLLPHEIRDERDHAGNGEQRGRIGRDQRCGRHHQMILLFEVIEITLCDFSGAHVMRLLVLVFY